MAAHASMAAVSTRAAAGEAGPHQSIAVLGILEDAAALEIEAVRVESSGDAGRDTDAIRLMERALLLRLHFTGSGGEGGGAGKGARPGAQCAPSQVDVVETARAAERLIVKCNATAVAAFKADNYKYALDLLENAMRLTDAKGEAFKRGSCPPGKRLELRGTTLNNLACLERRRGRLVPALDYIHQSVDNSNRNSAAALLNLSAILNQMGNAEEAVAAARSAVALLERNARAGTSVGTVDPMEEYNSLIAAAYNNLGTALEAVNVSEALAAFEQGLRVALATVGPVSDTTRSIQAHIRKLRERQQQALFGGTGTGDSGVLPSSHRAVGAPTGSATKANPRTLAMSLRHSSDDAAALASRPQTSSALPPIANALRRQQEAPARGATAVPSPGALGGRGGRGGEASTARAPRPPAVSSSGGGPPRKSQLDNAFVRTNSRRTSGGSTTTPDAGRSSRATPPPAAQLQAARPPGTDRGAVMRVASGSSQSSADNAVPLGVFIDRQLRRQQAALEGSSAGGGAAGAPGGARRGGAGAGPAGAPVASPSSASDILAFAVARLETLLQGEAIFEQHYRASKVIQCACRRHLARRVTEERRALRTSEVERRLAREHAMARRVQKSFKRFIASRRASKRRTTQRRQREEVRTDAATAIERIARGWLARNEAQRRRHFHAKHAVALQTLHNWFRKNLACAKVHRMRMVRDTVTAANLTANRRYNAAVDIQRIFRSVRSSNVSAKLRGERCAAREAEVGHRRTVHATRIERSFRGFLGRRRAVLEGRKRHHRNRMLLQAEDERRAVTVLQAFARGMAARTRVGPLRQGRLVNQETQEVDLRGTAATAIQRVARGVQAREHAAYRRRAKETLLREGRTGYCVELLQRVGFGFGIRRYLGDALAAEGERAAMDRAAAIHAAERERLAAEADDQRADEEAAAEAQRHVERIQAAAREAEEALRAEEAAAEQRATDEVDAAFAAQRVEAEEEEAAFRAGATEAEEQQGRAEIADIAAVDRAAAVDQEQKRLNLAELREKGRQQMAEDDEHRRTREGLTHFPVTRELPAAPVPAAVADEKPRASPVVPAIPEATPEAPEATSAIPDAPVAPITPYEFDHWQYAKRKEKEAAATVAIQKTARGFLGRQRAKQASSDVSAYLDAATACDAADDRAAHEDSDDEYAHDQEQLRLKAAAAALPSAPRVYSTDAPRPDGFRDYGSDLLRRKYQQDFSALDEAVRAVGGTSVVAASREERRAQAVVELFWSSYVSRSVMAFLVDRAVAVRTLQGACRISSSKRERRKRRASRVHREAAVEEEAVAQETEWSELVAAQAEVAKQAQIELLDVAAVTVQQHARVTVSRQVRRDRALGVVGGGIAIFRCRRDIVSRLRADKAAVEADTEAAAIDQEADYASSAVTGTVRVRAAQGKASERRLERKRAETPPTPDKSRPATDSSAPIPDRTSSPSRAHAVEQGAAAAVIQRAVRVSNSKEQASRRKSAQNEHWRQIADEENTAARTIQSSVRVRRAKAVREQLQLDRDSRLAAKRRAAELEDEHEPEKDDKGTAPGEVPHNQNLNGVWESLEPSIVHDIEMDSGSRSRGSQGPFTPQAVVVTTSPDPGRSPPPSKCLSTPKDAVIRSPKDYTSSDETTSDDSDEGEAEGGLGLLIRRLLGPTPRAAVKGPPIQLCTKLTPEKHTKTMQGKLYQIAPNDVVFRRIAQIQPKTLFPPQLLRLHVIYLPLGSALFMIHHLL